MANYRCQTPQSTKDISLANKLTQKVHPPPPHNATLHAMEILAQMAVATIIQTRKLKEIVVYTHINR